MATTLTQAEIDAYLNEARQIADRAASNAGELSFGQAIIQ